MRRSLGTTIRFILVVAVLAMIPVAFAPSTSTDTPYLSALSALGVGDLIAAPGCENKTCVHDAQGKALCKSNPGTYCLRKPNGVLCGGSTC
jgi:hypothetical protein